jgi:hypothetical protein
MLSMRAMAGERFYTAIHSRVTMPKTSLDGPIAINENRLLDAAHGVPRRGAYR